MISETAKMKIEEQSREKLIALVYEMVKEIGELKAEIMRLKQPPITSQNSSQPSSRDFNSEIGRRKMTVGGYKTQGAMVERRLKQLLLSGPSKVLTETCLSAIENIMIHFSSSCIAWMYPLIIIDFIGNKKKRPEG